MAQPPDRRRAEERIIHLNTDALQELFVVAEPDGCANVVLARNASISQAQDRAMATRYVGSASISAKHCRACRSTRFLRFHIRRARDPTGNLATHPKAG